MRRTNWLDRIVYRLFFWRWQPLLRERPDMTLFIANHMIKHVETRPDYQEVVKLYEAKIEEMDKTQRTA